VKKVSVIVNKIVSQQFSWLPFSFLQAKKVSLPTKAVAKKPPTLNKKEDKDPKDKNKRKTK
jgi:hypothetical protein